MSNKKIIILSVILSVIFLIVGLNVTPLLLRIIIQQLNKVGQQQVLFTTITATQQFQLHLFSALSFALIPILVMIVALVIKKLKQRIISSWDYFFHFAIILTSYLFGSYCKFYVLKFSIEAAIKKNVDTDLINSVPLANIKLYDWGFYASLVASILICVTVKKQKAT